MPRLPIPGADDNQWGNILNEYLSAVHNPDGTLKPNAVTSAVVANNSIGLNQLNISSSPNPNQVLSYNGTGLAWTTVSGGGSVPDADSTTKGLIQLTGHLGGTAANPTVPGLAGKENTISAGTSAQYYRGDKSWQALNKSAVGLANVDNTADTAKPISSLTQTALNAKADASDTVNLSGNQTITGTKNFTGTLQSGGQAVVATNDARLTNQRTPTDGSVTAAKLASESVTEPKLDATNTPTNGQILSYNGSNFTWVAAPTGGSDPVMGGDLSGNASNAQIAAGAIVNADISASAAIAQSKVANLSTDLAAKASTATTITGATSLTGGGSLAANRTISLVNDSATPGNSKYYGTNGSGSKGFYDLPAGGGGSIAVQNEGSTITSSATSLNFTGAGVNATDSSGAVTVNIPGGGSGTGIRPPYVLVASAQAPTDIKEVADFVCDGTNDDVTINSAIDAAALQPSNPTSYSSQGGYGQVVLSAGSFDITSPLLLKTGVHFEGQGVLTELRARNITSGAQSVFALADTSVHLTRVTKLWINGNYSAGGAHGFHYVSTGSTYLDRPSSNPDAGHWIDHIYMSGISHSSQDRHGIWTEGTSGGARAMKMSQIRMTGIYGNGIYLQGSSDSHMTDVEITTEGNGRSGFVINAGNCVLTSCKGWYCEQDGFEIISSRATLVNCMAQDNGRWGFNISGSNASVTGGQSDSNQRIDNDGGGVRLAGGSVSMVGMAVFDRAQSPQQQTRGIEFASALNGVRVDASVSVPSGSNHVVGTYNGSNNLISIVRNGTTPIVHGF